jgi:surface antigen
MVQLTMRLFTLLLLLIASPAFALNEGLQCVPYARALSGIEIRGDAHSWWDQAKGSYDRGKHPRVGAVMSFRSHGSMRLGHVAAVRKIVDNRTVLVSHANWSTIDGRRGHIEENVKVIDASDNNDWSKVRVWYTPNAAMGTTEFPINGFIYPKTKRSDGDARYALAQIIGSRAAIAPVSGGKSEILIAAYSPKISAGTFQLSSKTLADVNTKAALEKKTAWRTPTSEKNNAAKGAALR